MLVKVPLVASLYSRHLLSVLYGHLPNPKQNHIYRNPVQIHKLSEPVTRLISSLETNRGYHLEAVVQTNVLTTFRRRLGVSKGPPQPRATSRSTSKLLRPYYQLSNSRSVGNNSSGWTMSYVLRIDQSPIKLKGGQNLR